VESIFAYFDLNVVGLLWHSLNFAVLLVVLWWLFFRPITHLLEERERRVRESQARADETERLAALAEAERRELINAAHRDAATIRARGDEQGRALLARARTQARGEAELILQRARSVPASREDTLGRLNGHALLEPVGVAEVGKRG
jgi:F-type H+-transporting ATPase subunit b